MAKEQMVRGLVVTHGRLGEALVDATRRITGCDEDALTGLSNEGAGPAGLERTVREAAGPGPTILFTDLPSGSCSFAARKVAVQDASIAVVCGVNLPALVDFVFHRDLELAELVERLVEKGRGGIDGFGLEALEHADRSL